MWTPAPPRRSRGAAACCRRASSRVEGAFARGDCVLIRETSGAELGRGLIAYDAAEAGQLIGRNSRDIESVLGAPGRAEMIHRDDMALVGD